MLVLNLRRAAEMVRQFKEVAVDQTGDGVRRGLPTAARATLASRAPLTGLLGDGQVGSDLGRRLAHNIGWRKRRRRNGISNNFAIFLVSKLSGRNLISRFSALSYIVN